MGSQVKAKERHFKQITEKRKLDGSFDTLSHPNLVTFKKSNTLTAYTRLSDIFLLGWPSPLFLSPLFYKSGCVTREVKSNTQRV